MDSFGQIETKNNRSTPALKVLKRVSKSYEALQQGFILSLLNTHNYGIILKKPERRSIKTIQSLVVKSLILPNNYVFEFENELENHCNKLAMEELRQAKYYTLTPSNIESISEINKIVGEGYDLEKLKQIKRHREANRNSVAFNWLVKYAEDIGYVFGKRTSKPAQFTTKMIKIISVIGEDDKVEINQDLIEYIGIKFNQYIFEHFEKEENELIIKGNDVYIYNIVNNHEEVKGTLLKSLYEEELNEANALSVSVYQMNNDTNPNFENSVLKEDNNQVDNNIIEHVKKEEEEMECKEENESNNQSKMVAFTHCPDQFYDATQQEINELYQSIIDMKTNENANENLYPLNPTMVNTSQDGTYHHLPTIEVQKDEEVPNEIQFSQQIPEYSMEDEIIKQIRDYYDNYENDEMNCYSFIQSYNF